MSVFRFFLFIVHNDFLKYEIAHKDDSCIVVQPTQKEATQVVNFIQQRPGIQGDQWRTGELA